jgi:hypothetical protein
MFDPISHSNQNRQSTNVSANFDANASERMKMEYLKKEKERREKERYKMEYDIKKKDFDRLSQDKVRYELDKRRIEGELAKYKFDLNANRNQEGK